MKAEDQQRQSLNGSDKEKETLPSSNLETSDIDPTLSPFFTSTFVPHAYLDSFFQIHLPKTNNKSTINKNLNLNNKSNNAVNNLLLSSLDTLTNFQLKSTELLTKLEYKSNSLTKELEILVDGLEQNGVIIASNNRYDNIDDNNDNDEDEKGGEEEEEEEEEEKGTTRLDYYIETLESSIKGLNSDISNVSTDISDTLFTTTTAIKNDESDKKQETSSIIKLANLNQVKKKMELVLQVLTTAKSISMTSVPDEISNENDGSLSVETYQRQKKVEFGHVITTKEFQNSLKTIYNTLSSELISPSSNEQLNLNSKNEALEQIEFMGSLIPLFKDMKEFSLLYNEFIKDLQLAVEETEKKEKEREEKGKKVEDHKLSTFNNDGKSEEAAAGYSGFISQLQRRIGGY